jgi:hypothetical protein
LRDSRSGIEIKVVFSAGGTIALAGFLIPQAGKLIATADAITVTGFGGGLDWNERHAPASYVFLFFLARDGQEGALDLLGGHRFTRL